MLAGPPEPDRQWKVGELKGLGPGRNVFRHRIPAVKASDFGPGGRSHLVLQDTDDGRRVVRNISEREEERLFQHPAVPMEWGSETDEAAE